MNRSRSSGTDFRQTSSATVWLYFRFSMSYRDVVELRAERDIDLSYQAVQTWALQFGEQFAGNLYRRRPKPTGDFISR